MKYLPFNSFNVAYNDFTTTRAGRIIFRTPFSRWIQTPYPEGFGNNLLEDKEV